MNANPAGRAHTNPPACRPRTWDTGAKAQRFLVEHLLGTLAKLPGDMASWSPGSRAWEGRQVPLWA